MAFTLLGAQGAFVPASRDNLTGNAALAAFATQDPTGIANLLQGTFSSLAYDARAQATTTTNDTGVLIDLSARGVTFPAGFIRLIRTDAFARTVGSTVDAVWVQTHDIIVGATNPVRIIPAAGVPRISVLTAAVTAAVTAQAAVNTGPTPDTVEIQLLGMTAIALTWDVRVYVSPLIPLA